MNITVYLGANYGEDEIFTGRVRELGRFIAESGNTLVYGGSKTGLMGEIAESALGAGGSVIGVEPRFLVEKDMQYDRLSELVVTESLSARKDKMIELGNAFIAFPGGTGTLDEISEIAALVALDRLKAPCMFYNIRGYYDGVKILLDKMIECGFSSKERQERIFFPENLDEIKVILKNTVKEAH